MNRIIDLNARELKNLCLLWNADWALNQIADYYSLDIYELQRYMATRPGFPGEIKKDLGRPRYTFSTYMEKRKAHAQSHS